MKQKIPRDHRGQDVQQDAEELQKYLHVETQTHAFKGTFQSITHAFAVFGSLANSQDLSARGNFHPLWDV